MCRAWGRVGSTRISSEVLHLPGRPTPPFLYFSRRVSIDPMRIGAEARLEDECRKRIRRSGGRCIKIEGERGDPDRLIVLPGSVLFFCEFKRPGQKPDPLQAFRLQKFREAGHVAGWVDSIAEFYDLWTAAKDARRGVEEKP